MRSKGKARDWAFWLALACSSCAAADPHATPGDAGTSGRADAARSVTDVTSPRFVDPPALTPPTPARLEAGTTAVHLDAGAADHPVTSPPPAVDARATGPADASPPRDAAPTPPAANAATTPMPTATPAGSAPVAADAGAPSPGGVSHVFVIVMENHSAGQIYGNPAAPYINNVLLPAGSSAAAFADELPGFPSEPHYIWMEAGTNAFADHTFTTDDSPSPGNSTASTQHLATQLRAAGLDWVSYQEGMTPGTCPVQGAGPFVPRHDPFVFFKDLAGDPPSTGASLCAAHHKPASALGADLASGAVPAYVFITPDLCNDMHGSSACPAANWLAAGDTWLSQAVPPILAYANAHQGVLFIAWDEGVPLPFIALGPRIKPGYRSSAPFNHGSILKTVEHIFRLPALPTVAATSDLGDLFLGGSVP